MDKSVLERVTKVHQPRPVMRGVAVSLSAAHEGEVFAHAVGGVVVRIRHVWKALLAEERPRRRGRPAREVLALRVEPLLSCPRHIVLTPPIFQTRRNELKMRQGSMKPSDGKRIAALLRFTSAAAVAAGRNDSSDSRHSASVSANAASSFAKDSGSSDALANRFRSM